jgi:hypothetical protein
VFPAGRLPGLQYSFCIPRVEHQTTDPQAQKACLLVQTHGCRESMPALTPPSPPEMPSDHPALLVRSNPKKSRSGICNEVRSPPQPTPTITLPFPLPLRFASPTLKSQKVPPAVVYLPSSTMVTESLGQPRPTHCCIKNVLIAMSDT